MKYTRKISLLPFFSLSLLVVFGLGVGVRGARAEVVTNLPYSHSISSQTYKFPAISGSSSFDVISLPETTYTKPIIGSAIFTARSGTTNSSHYLNLAHTGRVNETTDTFLLSAFTQAMCDGEAAQPVKEQSFTARFTKPVMTVLPDQIQIRAYDAFTVSWGNHLMTVTMKRYWRVIDLPAGKTAATFSPNDYYISNPRVAGDDIDDTPDTPSPETVTFTLSYEGNFAPIYTRISHGDPYETSRFVRPMSVEVDHKTNADFNFYNIQIRVNGETATPDTILCELNKKIPDLPKTEPCGCLNNNQVLACGDPQEPFQDFWPPVQFSLFTGTQYQIESIGDMRDAINGFGDQALTDPEVNLQVNKVNPVFNENFLADALALNFKSKPEDNYFAWCVDGKTQQGLVAGGERIDETISTDDTKSADAVGCCNFATRTPESGHDANGDGIDDAWQEKYFYRLTGKKGLLDPKYDKDGDGYVADRYLDLNGERIAVAPSSRGSNGVPYTTGDGSFTAAEEYIWGTNPLEYDSDQDGYPDEADIAGVGQRHIDFVPDIQPREYPKNGQQFGGDRFLLSVKTVGRTPKKRSITIDPKDATKETGLALQDVVRVSDASRWFFAKDEGAISAQLSHEPSNPGLNDTVSVQVNANTGTRPESSLLYQWYLKRVPGNQNPKLSGKPDGKTVFRSGPNLQSLSFSLRAECPECRVGDHLEVSLDLIDTVSHQVTSVQDSVPVGADNSLLKFQDCNRDGTEEEVGGVGYCFKSVQVTNNIPVRVDLTFFDADSNNYYYQWYLDHVLQSSNCLNVGETVASGVKKCGFGTSQMVFTPKKLRTTHDVEVYVYRKDLNIPEGQFIPVPGSEVAHITDQISVGNPSVTLTFEPPLASGATGYNIGDVVQVRANVEFLDPNPAGQLPTGEHQLQYTWYDTFGGKIKTEQLNSLTGSVIALVPQVPGVFSPSVKVESPDYVTGASAQMVPVVGKVTTYFAPAASNASALLQLNARIASISRFIPWQVQSVARVVSVVTLFGGVVVFFWWLPRSRMLKR